MPTEKPWDVWEVYKTCRSREKTVYRISTRLTILTGVNDLPTTTVFLNYLFFMKKMTAKQKVPTNIECLSDERPFKRKQLNPAKCVKMYGDFTG